MADVWSTDQGQEALLQHDRAVHEPPTTYSRNSPVDTTELPSSTGVPEVYGDEKATVLGKSRALRAVVVGFIVCAILSLLFNAVVLLDGLVTKTDPYSHFVVNAFSRVSYDVSNIGIFFVLAFSLSSVHLRLFFGVSVVHYTMRAVLFSVYMAESISQSVRFERVAFNTIFALFSAAVAVNWRRVHQYLQLNPPETASLGLHMQLLSFYVLLLLPRLTLMIEDSHSPWADEDLTMYIVTSGFLLLFSRVWLRRHLGKQVDLTSTTSLLHIMSKLTTINLIDLAIIGLEFVGFGITYVIRMSQDELKAGEGRLSNNLADSLWYIVTILFFVSFTFRLLDIADLSHLFRPWSKCCAEAELEPEDRNHYRLASVTAVDNMV